MGDGWWEAEGFRHADKGARRSSSSAEVFSTREAQFPWKCLLICVSIKALEDRCYKVLSYPATTEGQSQDSRFGEGRFT